MPHVTRFLVRSLSAMLLTLAAPLTAAAAQADTGFRASMTEALSFADSAARADSVRVIAELLAANGAPDHRARPAAAAIMKYSRLRALDPLLVVGIIGVENARLAPRARSGAGARGAMQVMPHWRKDIRDCGADLSDITVNICFGTRILRIALDETTSVRQALLRYNGCVRAPGCHTYASAVFSRAGQALLLSRGLAARPTMVAQAPATVAAATTTNGGGTRDDP